VWEQEFEWSGVLLGLVADGEHSPRPLTLKVFDWDSIAKLKSDDPLGNAAVDLSSLLKLPFDQQMQQRKWHLSDFAVQLRAAETGTVILRARWEPAGMSIGAMASTAHGSGTSSAGNPGTSADGTSLVTPIMSAGGKATAVSAINDLFARRGVGAPSPSAPSSAHLPRSKVSLGPGEYRVTIDRNAARTQHLAFQGRQTIWGALGLVTTPGSNGDPIVERINAPSANLAIVPGDELLLVNGVSTREAPEALHKALTSKQDTDLQLRRRDPTDATETKSAAGRLAGNFFGKRSVEAPF